MGNTIQILSPWTEGNAISQLENCATLHGMHSVVGLPDLHAGRGYPVGAAFFAINHLYPALIGNDIGCGMGLWETNMPQHQFKMSKVEKQLQKYRDFADEAWLDDLSQTHLPQKWKVHPYARSLGSIGGGNHFAEFQKITKVLNPAKLESLGLSERHVYLLVHSGSRGLGESILRHHIAQFNHDGLENPTAQLAYLSQHDAALEYARLNRALIAKRMLETLKMAGMPRLDLFHNYVERVMIEGKEGFLHRKGASPSTNGFAMIPGSRGACSYLVIPKPNEASLFSIAHGAGRKWMRSECKGRLEKQYGVHELNRTTLGSRVICENRDLLYEEAPEAYKNIEAVIKVLVDADLIEVVAELSPLITYKTSGEK